jgi:hypothetical protein
MQSFNCVLKHFGQLMYQELSRTSRDLGFVAYRSYARCKTCFAGITGYSEITPPGRSNVPIGDIPGRLSNSRSDQLFDTEIRSAAPPTKGVPLQVWLPAFL